MKPREANDACIFTCKRSSSARCRQAESDDCSGGTGEVVVTWSDDVAASLGCRDFCCMSFKVFDKCTHCSISCRYLCLSLRRALFFLCRRFYSSTAGSGSPGAEVEEGRSTQGRFLRLEMKPSSLMSSHSSSGSQLTGVVAIGLLPLVFLGIKCNMGPPCGYNTSGDNNQV